MGRKRRDIPWLSQRDNGVFYAYWYDDAARQTRSETLDTRDPGEARIAFANFLVRGPRSAKHVGDAGVTVDQILTWYDTGVPGRFPGHISEKVVDKGRQRIAINTLRTHFGKTLARDVNIEVGEEYARLRREGKIVSRRRGTHDMRAADSTIRRELAVLESASAWCVKRDLLPADQAVRIEKPIVPQEKAPWLTKESIRAMIDGSDGHLRAFIRMTYYWGARRRSVETLTVDQVDLKHSRVDLHKAGTPRTKKRRPIVPIYPEIRKDIETLLIETNNEYLFGQPKSFRFPFEGLVKKLAIPVVDAPAGEVPWPHLLRHSRATHMLMDGEDIYKVARLLGDTVETVERVYGHHTPEYLQTKSNVEVG